MLLILASAQLIELKKVFSSAPFIYTSLLLLSVVAVSIWTYSLLLFQQRRIAPDEFMAQLRQLLQEREYAKARAFCEEHQKIFGSIVLAGLSTRSLGAQVMMDAMKSEGKRCTASCWQRLSLLNDIAIVAPMIGLLGTVVGMFYAFYDVNRSVDSINALYDGLGISVGTTVAGLIVAIVSMILHTTLKYRVVQTLSQLENEALSLSPLIHEEK